MTFKTRGKKLAVSLLFIFLPIQGCIWGSVQYDRTLEKEVIAKITPGKTTRKEILKWLGPPEVLAQKDDRVSIPTLEDGQVIEVNGNEEVEYDGEIHTAANLFDALKEGYYGKH